MLKISKPNSQALFILGAAALGVAPSRLVDLEGFKNLDVDAILRLTNTVDFAPMLSHNKEKQKALRTTILKRMAEKEPTLQFLQSSGESGKLPNVYIRKNITNPKDLQKAVYFLILMGYSTEALHVAWMLPDFRVILQKNNVNEVQPEDLEIKAHTGNPLVLSAEFQNLPHQIDGTITSVLIGDQVAYVYKENEKGLPSEELVPAFGAPPSKSKRRVIYIPMKQPRKGLADESLVKKLLFNWIKKNAPKNSTARKLLNPKAV